MGQKRARDDRRSFQAAKKTKTQNPPKSPHPTQETEVGDFPRGGDNGMEVQSGLNGFAHLYQISGEHPVLKVGQVVGGRVINHSRNGVLVKLTAGVIGTLHPTDVSDNYDLGNPFPSVNSKLKAAILEIDDENKRVILSTRSSRSLPEVSETVVDREVKSLADLKVGDTVRGFIKNVAEHGLFVFLGRDVDARVQIKELFDEFVEDWKTKFKANQVVKGRILAVNMESKKIEMTFRSNDIKRNTLVNPTLLSDLRDGQKVHGRVKRVERYGVFIQIDNSNLSGLCHTSELSDNEHADVSVALLTFKQGDPVEALIVSIDREKRKISFSLKPSHFVDDNPQSDNDVIEGLSDHAIAVDANDDENSESADDSDAEVISEVEFDHIQNDTTAVLSSKTKTHPTSLRPRGFQWLNTATASENPVDSEDSEEEVAPEKTKKRRKKAIVEDLTADSRFQIPESNAGFERLLLSSPNSSFIWIQYMSFQLQLSEVERARELGRRAIQIIDFHDEQEKLNVWVALLNLENAFGTEETLSSTFKDAARHSNSKAIHLRLADIFEQSNQNEKAEEQFSRTCKKFGRSSKVWTLFAEHYFRHSAPDQARALLPRSLQCLEKRKHIKTISKFAQIEYRLGDAERGRAIFEGIVDSHVRRWDIWSVYIDMEAAQGSIPIVRNLFNRLFSGGKVTSHQARHLFKQWLRLEESLGDGESVESVKLKAMEWIQQAARS